MKRFKRFFSFSSLGTIFLIIAVSIPILFYWPLISSELRYQVRRLTTRRQQVSWNPYETVLSSMPDTSFSLYIPKIDAKGKVFKDVSVRNKKEYLSVLKKGIAHAEGTLLPGNGTGNIFLFAHSTDSPLNMLRYNAVFYLLRKLEKGDEVFLSYEDKPYRYVVREKKIVDPTDVSYLTAENKQSKEQVILLTCYPPGTIENRLLVFAERVDFEQAFADTLVVK